MANKLNQLSINSTIRSKLQLRVKTESNELNSAIQLNQQSSYSKQSPASKTMFFNTKSNLLQNNSPLIKEDLVKQKKNFRLQLKSNINVHTKLQEIKNHHSQLDFSEDQKIIYQNMSQQNQTKVIDFVQKEAKQIQKTFQIQGLNQQMQTNIPNPSQQRKDIQQLNNWLSQKIQVLQEDENYYFNLVTYSKGGFLELKRQISEICVESAILIGKFWDINEEIYMKIIEQKNGEIKQNIDTFEKQYENQQQRYLKIISRYEDQCIQRDSQINQLNQSISQHKKALDYKRNKINHISMQAFEFKNLFQDAEQQIITIQQENSKFKKLWEHISNSPVYNDLIRSIQQNSNNKINTIKQQKIVFQLDDDFMPDFENIAVNTDISIKPDKDTADKFIDNFEMISEFNQNIEIQTEIITINRECQANIVQVIDEKSQQKIHTEFSNELIKTLQNNDHIPSELKKEIDNIIISIKQFEFDKNRINQKGVEVTFKKIEQQINSFVQTLDDQLLIKIYQLKELNQQIIALQSQLELKQSQVIQLHFEQRKSYLKIEELQSKHDAAEVKAIQARQKAEELEIEIQNIKFEKNNPNEERLFEKSKKNSTSGVQLKINQELQLPKQQSSHENQHRISLAVPTKNNQLRSSVKEKNEKKYNNFNENPNIQLSQQKQGYSITSYPPKQQQKVDDDIEGNQQFYQIQKNDQILEIKANKQIKSSQKQNQQQQKFENSHHHQLVIQDKNSQKLDSFPSNNNQLQVPQLNMKGNKKNRSRINSVQRSQKSRRSSSVSSSSLQCSFISNQSSIHDDKETDGNHLKFLGFLQDEDKQQNIKTLKQVSIIKVNEFKFNNKKIVNYENLIGLIEQSMKIKNKVIEYIEQNPRQYRDNIIEIMNYQVRKTLISVLNQQIKPEIMHKTNFLAQIYELYLQRFGIKNIADHKFQQFLKQFTVLSRHINTSNFVCICASLCDINKGILEPNDFKEFQFIYQFLSNHSNQNEKEYLNSLAELLQHIHNHIDHQNFLSMSFPEIQNLQFDNLILNFSIYYSKISKNTVQLYQQLYQLINQGNPPDKNHLLKFFNCLNTKKFDFINYFDIINQNTFSQISLKSFVVMINSESLLSLKDIEIFLINDRQGLKGESSFQKLLEWLNLDKESKNYIPDQLLELYQK